MKTDCEIIRLSEKREYIETAAEWFADKWSVPEEEYRKSMAASTEPGKPVPSWYIVTCEAGNIIAGAGVIENDFHDRKDLTPNLCALFVEEEYRGRGIAGELLNKICVDMASGGITRLYLITDHDGFYERYGWYFLTMVREDDGGLIRMYAHDQQHVVVKDYDPAWADEFEREAALIKSALGKNCAAVHHIGSTSVPGLAAKPVIDIMPVVKSLDDADEAKERLEELGYEYLGEFGIPGRRYLRKGGSERTHQVHIFAEGDSGNIERHLALRDYLRSHTDVRDEYGRLKKSLAEKYPYDIESYCDGKDEFVKKAERAALEWKRRTGETGEKAAKM